MFLFLKYIRPTWYYRLYTPSSAKVLVDFTKLDSSNEALITPDYAYEDDQATLLDAAYQGLNNGIIPNEMNSIQSSRLSTVHNINHNYRFVKKFFGLHWYIYTYVIRILTFNNPLLETTAFVTNLRVPRKLLYQKSDSESLRNKTTLRKHPLVSIVIPTLNRYEYLKDVLSDLEMQEYKNFEVLVCDQTDIVDSDFYSGWNLDLKLIKQKEKALWLARNICIKESKGDYILLFDDDSRVEPDWIRNHLYCLEYFNADISAGVTDTLVGHGLSAKDDYFHISDVFDTGNALVKKEVFKRVGLFDRQFEKQRMGDGEFGLRCYLSGYQLISNPLAKRIHLKVATGGLRQMGSWDALHPKGFFSPRPVPSVLYLFRKYFGTCASVFFLFQNIYRTIIPYKKKKSKYYKLFALCMIPLAMPWIIISVVRSWQFASSKLKAGAIIDRL